MDKLDRNRYFFLKNPKRYSYVQIMSDQDSISVSNKKTEKTSIDTKNQGVEDAYLDITTLIRSVQRVEGNFDCFLRAEEYCDQIDCCWRPYCLKSHYPEE